MTLPRGYDAWRLSGPEDDRDCCPACEGATVVTCMNCGGEGEVADGIECPECDGLTTVPCDCNDEPDGDYLFERARDARMEDGQ